MAVCIKVQGKHRQICAGDLDRQITLQDRAITTNNLNVDFVETFTENSIVWAMIETVRGSVYFDDVDTERQVTHKFYIRFIEGVTAETWILYNNERYDILDTENLEERSEWLLLMASKTGSSTRVAANI